MTPGETAGDLAFRARALAQAHPLTAAAYRYRAWRLARDASQHPNPELTTWASTAFLTGYCIRCVEEAAESPVGHATGEGATSAGSAGDPEERALTDWERRAVAVADGLAGPAAATLGPAEAVLAAIDDVIARELEKRHEHVRDTARADQWERFERFVGWWVVHGYAVRASEDGAGDGPDGDRRAPLGAP